jgi:hypothetical protein
LDKFYTKDEIALQCVMELYTANLFDRAAACTFLEPSAGGGAFCRALPQHFPQATVLAIDIEPGGDGIEERDFLAWSPPLAVAGDEPPSLYIVGNPPFGKNASLAVKFFNRAATLQASIIAFILPCSVLKASVQNKMDEHYELSSSRKLADNSFCFDGKAVDVPCVWQIWKRLPAHRIRPKIAGQEVFSGVCTIDKGFTADCHVMVQRVGVRAGRMTWDKSAMQKYIGSGNFRWITFLSGADAALIECDQTFSLESLQCKFHTAGMPSLTNAEIVNAISRYVISQREAAGVVDDVRL